MGELERVSMVIGTSQPIVPPFPPQVTLRIFQNKNAAHADVVNKPYDPKSYKLMVKQSQWDKQNDQVSRFAFLSNNQTSTQS